MIEEKIIKEGAEELEKACGGLLSKPDLPLWVHLLDTANAMERIITESISLKEIREMEEELGGETFIRTGVFCSLIHDIGKATACMQNLLFRKSAAAVPPDIPLEPDENPEGKHHTITGSGIAKSLGLPDSYAMIVGAHHGKITDISTCVTKPSTNDYQALYGYKPADSTVKFWKSTWKKIVKAALYIAGFADMKDLPALSVRTFSLMTAYLIEADWLASNEDNFPRFNPSEPFTYTKERAEKGWKKAKVQSRFIHSAEPVDFNEIFKKKPYEYQKEIMETVQSCQDPGLFICEAPTGSGKTEAALAASEIISQNEGTSGVYFGLPTIATSNNLMPRFKEWTKDNAKNSDTKSVTFMLSHSAADLNDTYNALWQKNSHPHRKNDDGLIVNEYLSGKLGLLPNFIVGTIDSFLRAGMNTRHVMLRHAGLAGKVVVLDEVHAYDAYMSTILDTVLNWMGVYGVPVIILTATLTKKRKAELMKAYLKGKGLKKKEADAKAKRAAENDAYPLLTYTSQTDIKLRALTWSRRRKYTVARHSVSSREEELAAVENIIRKASSGGCTGIIVNDTRTAGKLADMLRDKLTDKKVILLTARLSALRRMQVEREIEFHTGRSSTGERRRDVVVVGTQILE